MRLPSFHFIAIEESLIYYSLSLVAFSCNAIRYLLKRPLAVKSFYLPPVMNFNVAGQCL
jgi:hypothetical protein